MKNEEKRKKEKKNGKNPKFDIRDINWCHSTISPPPSLNLGWDYMCPNPPETQNTEINNLNQPEKSLHVINN